MRLIPQLLRPRPKLARIAISQEEITADLLYPSGPRRVDPSADLGRTPGPGR